MAEFVEVMKQKERMCKSMEECAQCKIGSKCNGIGCTCHNFLIRCSKEAEEIIMKWAKENPIVTNADKFEKIFKRPLKNAPVILNDWWYEEYKGEEDETDLFNW